MLMLSAKHKRTLIKVVMYYNTIFEAKKDNPGYEDFEVIGGVE